MYNSSTLLQSLKVIKVLWIHARWGEIPNADEFYTIFNTYLIVWKLYDVNYVFRCIIGLEISCIVLKIPMIKPLGIWIAAWIFF